METQLPTTSSCASMPLSSPPDPERRPATSSIGLAAILLATFPHVGPLAREAEAQKAQRAKRPKRAASRMDSAFVEAGRLYIGRKYEQALDAYREYLKSKPDIKPAVRAMVDQKVALCLAQLGRGEEALAKLEQVLAAHKDTPAAASTQICRGEVLGEEGVRSS